ncbi:MAG: VWA domain-containing protein [Promethearchaeota archaeon]|nr:MAG: VWA domain-containing protein [Candidatus Lokiarchaeota archaeon]
MHDIQIEDTVLVLDNSRSMLRSDFEPSRLSVAKEVVKNFITSKLAIDPKDRISILSYGDGTKKIHDFSNDEISLFKSLEKTVISGKGVIHDAVAFSLQLIVEEMRKIGGKVHRIFIISDNKLEHDSEHLNKLAEIAKGLGIFIDTCQIGNSPSSNKNILKKISQSTNGEFGYFNNEKAVINAGKSFASKKMVKHAPDYFTSKKKEKGPPLMSEVALPLRRASIMEIRLMMKNGGMEQEKCQICHSVKAPTGADFYSEGRFCPNCDRPMHLSCATLWAKKSEHGKNTFRCPFCYFLLKVPKTMTKLVKSKVEESKKVKIIDEQQDRKTRMIEIASENIDQINESCTYCHNIFLGKYKVYKCQNCGSHYHEPCLRKMHVEIKACRFCGSKIDLN